MKKIIDYAISHGPKTIDIMLEVMEMINEGWEPLGGIAMAFDEYLLYYSQAMVKYESDVDGLIEILEE